jgi:hypothetical protein
MPLALDELPVKANPARDALAVHVDRYSYGHLACAASPSGVDTSRTHFTSAQVLTRRRENIDGPVLASAIKQRRYNLYPRPMRLLLTMGIL